MTKIKKSFTPKKPTSTKKTANLKVAKPRTTKVTKTKSTTKKQKSKKSALLRKRWLGWVWNIVWKLGFAFAMVMLFVGFYLNSLVQQRFDSSLFDLSTVVYSRILTLTPDDNISMNEVKRELDILNYRKVAHPRYPGEYSSSSTKIELIRRPFEFDDGPEPDRHAMLYFNNEGLIRIQSLEQNRDFGHLRIEPKMLGMLEQGNSEQRLFLRREQFPEIMIDALLATEDRHFYQHDGVSPMSIIRALFANLKAGRTVQGGSTLTQQLAKNTFLSRERTLWRKLSEFYIALIIDYRYSKDRILEAYLNEVYLGQNGGEAIHGFGLASRLYFGQPLQELRIDQFALLVGMVKGPSYYNPKRYPERAKTRRDLVLKLMMQQGLLTAKQYEVAASRSLDIQKNLHIASRQPAYFQQVNIELKEKLGGRFKDHAGLRVFTSLDPISQSMLEKAIVNQMPKLVSTAVKDLEAAAIAVDRHSGEIRAMVGGKRTGYDGFNRALNADRPIGSLVKPAVYLTALEQADKYNLATTLEDKPLSLKGSQGNIWSPRNYDRQFRGNVPLYLSLAKSLNVTTVRLGMQLGIENVADTLERLGVDKNEIRLVPSMFLGAFSLTPYQVAQMYQTLTNSGKKAQLSALRSVLDLNGNVVYESIPKVSQAVEQQAAWLTTYAMKQAIIEGTGRSLHQSFSWALLAGKTGTTNDNRDSWFVGVDGREVTTIWLGRDDNQPIKLTGSSGALKVYAEYLALRVPQKLSLPWPKGITTIGFARTENGVLTQDCSNQFKLPVWDKNNTFKKNCERQSEQQKERQNNEPADWLKKIFQ